MSAPGDSPYVSCVCTHCGGTVQRLNGAWLRVLREFDGLTLRALARKARTTPAYVSDIERGRRFLSKTGAASRRLAKAYGIEGWDVEFSGARGPWGVSAPNSAASYVKWAERVEST